MTRRRVAIALAVALVASTTAAVAAWRLWPEGCLDESVEAREVGRPFPDDPPDDRLRPLVRAADGWGLGGTRASIGYDYDRFVELASLPGMLAVWRKGDPVVAAVDAVTGDPAWGIRQARVRHTWDASDERFLMVAAPADAAPEVAAYAMTSGERRWCVRLGQDPLSAEDPIATGLNTAGDVLVLAGTQDALRLTALSGDDGEERWSRRLAGVDRGDHLGPAWDGVVVAGGRPAHELMEEPTTDSGVLAGLAEDTGEVRWRHRVEEGTTVSVAGESDGRVVVRERGPEGHRLVALDQSTGRALWRRPVADARADVAVRGPVVLVRTARELRALDIDTGEAAWRSAVRQVPQQFPYGFSLAEQPMLDADTLLLGATDGIWRLRLSDGRRDRWALPTDGVNTTYWPYRVAVTSAGAGSGPVVAIATNTGAVVVGGR